MTKESLNVTIHNVETGEIVIQPMTPEEIAIYERDQLESQAMLAEKEAKAIAKAAAQAKLATLGLTTDDLKALGL